MLSSYTNPVLTPQVKKLFRIRLIKKGIPTAEECNLDHPVPNELTHVVAD